MATWIYQWGDILGYMGDITFRVGKSRKFWDILGLWILTEFIQWGIFMDISWKKTHLGAPALFWTDEVELHS